ncbi:NrsF family protein [Parasphingopyxis marina]|uniref:DUF1109 domain-containing protein n=1 Tax=Parasphingopyxis marina TaxID=2761622 RepID=A0A842I006_9SPHN|nr:DUF1109 domain-containing protein [Parasphingopyxis marina]MBC2778786.1 DUF1109 domain-containing protein [Parasphingopyxis marina]
MADRFDLDALADALTPVRPVNPAIAAAVVGMITLTGTGVVTQLFGWRSGMTEPMFLMRSGLLLIVGVASLAAVTGMARPAVGMHRTGWRWAAGACAVVPVAAFVTAFAGETPVADRIYPGDGIFCLVISIGIGTAIAAALTLWLRRGAPVSPERAGIVTGLSAGSFGTFAYSMHCPHDDIVYFGLWYTLAIAATTIAGRLLVPRLIRW